MPSPSPTADQQSSTLFAEVSSLLESKGVQTALDRLIVYLQEQHKYHELFDALLMRARHSLGLPVVLTTSIDDLEESLRVKVEEAYLDACRRVGGLLLGEGKLREAWMYLRPVGDKRSMAAVLEAAQASDENVQDLIELALHEGVSPVRGFQLVLDNYGTCNAITTFDGLMSTRPRTEQAAAAALLVRRLHSELSSNVKSDIARQAGSPASETTLRELVADRDWLLGENNYHIDTTHLASTVRAARVIEDKELLTLAADLTEYGRRLNPQFQFAGEEPFADVYPAHRLFFVAQLGQDVDEAIDYFRERADGLDVNEHGPMPAETLIVLLARLGRYADAIRAHAKYLPRGTRSSGFAPSLLELSRLAGDYTALLQLCQEHEDLIGYAAAIVTKQTSESGSR
jgi:hypothetical protein